ncbi:hypothetical protein GM3709_2932 [Geminocystis sp. NIES-3709]|nr:hypothetical protein GM3709_2932 [Geminocystis sp. NIES-3709]
MFIISSINMFIAILDHLWYFISISIVVLKAIILFEDGDAIVSN